MKKTIKYLNFFLFIVSLCLLITLQSYTNFSTSLFSVLANNDTKKIIESFEKTQSSHILLVAVKGFDDKSLVKMKKIEKQLDALALLSLNINHTNDDLMEHKKAYKLLIQEVNETKLFTLDASKTLKRLYDEMTSSFFPVSIDKVDPFQVLHTQKPTEVPMKNGHLTLGKYGYMCYFTLTSRSLKEHEYVYENIHKIMSETKNVQFFSPIFYYVENSRAIRSDVQNIIYIAFSILILLYLVILKDILLLTHTFTTLATSAMLATVVLTQAYEQISIFVFVFGISISTVAIDYMFHHYFHGYYSENNIKKKRLNTEVLFGFLTTFFAFFILSFTSFLLIKQIAFFTMISLFVSYIHFAFLYPMLEFKALVVRDTQRKKFFCTIPPKLFLFISLGVILTSSMWVHFDFNVKNLDYNNQELKKKEHFFKSQNASYEKISFVIKGDTIDTLVRHSKEIQNKVPTVHVSLSSLMSQSLYQKNKDIFMRAKTVKVELNKEAKKLGFKKGYFDDAYIIEKPFIVYTEKQVKNYGLEIMKIDDYYITFGIVDKKHYADVLHYDFIRSLSIKEHFELFMQKSIHSLGLLGLLIVLLIIVVLLVIARSKVVYALVFLLFPIALMSLYGLFFSINILHLFMLFIILAIGIDYAIYMVTNDDTRTKKAISYSLVSTFAGFGVLVFSQINALYSLGVIAIIGIGAILMLLLCMKEG